MKEEWSYKLLIDLSYEKTLQSIYAEEWLNLQEKINLSLEKGDFVAESHQLYRLQSPFERQYLFRALETALDLQTLLLEQQWIVEFNLLFIFTSSLNKNVQLLCCDLPAVNRVWIPSEERLLNKYLLTKEYGNFCSVERRQEKKNSSEKDFKRLAQPLIPRLKACYEKKQACMVVDKALNGNSHVMMKLLNLCFPNSRVIELNAFAARCEPFKLLQPLINYCNRQHQTVFPTHFVLWTRAYLSHYFAAELQKALAKEENIILLIKDNKCWHHELEEILHTFLKLQIPLFLTFAEDSSLVFDTSKFSNMSLLQAAKNVDMETLFLSLCAPFPKSFEKFCADKLSTEEQKLLVFVMNTEGLIRWEEMIALWPEQRSCLEHLFMLELIKDEQGFLFACVHFSSNVQPLDMYQDLLNYWCQEKQQFDLEHLFFLNECRLLGEDDLLKGCQQLAEREMLPSLLKLAARRKEQQQSWPEYCHYLLNRLEGQKEQASLLKNSNDIFLKALLYYQQDEFEQVRRDSQKLLLNSVEQVRHPLYVEALFLQVSILIRQKKFLDARFLLDQIAYSGDCSPFKNFLINFYRSVNFFYQHKLDKTETSLNTLIAEPLYLPYWEIYAHFFKVRLLFLCGEYKQAAMLAEQLYARAQQQTEAEWEKISCLWYLRSLCYLAEYDKVIEKLLAQPLSCERDFILAETYLFSGKRKEAILILESLLDKQINALSPPVDGFQLLDAFARPHSYHALLQEVYLLLALAYLLEGRTNQADRCLRLYKLDKDLSGSERFYFILFLKEKLNGNSYQKKHSLYLSHAASLASSQLYAIEDTTLRAAVQQQNIWYRHIATATVELEQLFPVPS